MDEIAQLIRLPDYCRVFQAEAGTIQAAARITGDRRVSKRYVTVLSDSQVDNKALSSNVMNTKSV